MNIIFFSELNSQGEISDDIKNMRTDFTFCKLLDGIHISYNELLKPDGKYQSVIDNADFAVLIPSKKYPQLLEAGFTLHKKGIPFGMMQEGPNLYWQSWPSAYQIMYLAIIEKLASVVFCHNEYDKEYFEGLTDKPVIVDTTTHFVSYWADYIMPVKDKAESVFVGGNMTSWYNGMTSYLVARHSGVQVIGLPTMGNSQKDEADIMPKLDERVQYYPFMDWGVFMQVLTSYKYAIHLMPSVAAGSFNLNCAMLGVPCIGNINEDTQQVCFPDLSIDINDTKKAKELLDRLINDKEFYNMVREKAINNVKYFDINHQRSVIRKEIKDALKKK